MNETSDRSHFTPQGWHTVTLRDLENIEKRASSAYRELHEAHYFQHVIPNHDGEDSENWDAFYHPSGMHGWRCSHSSPCWLVKCRR